MDIKSDFIHQSQIIQANVHAIAGELARRPTTDQKYRALTQKLDASLKILLSIKEQASGTLFATDGLETEIISLYGRVTDQWMKSKIDSIEREASQLADSLVAGHVSPIAVQRLFMRIRSFKRDYLPCSQDRTKIAVAEEILSQARAFLKGEVMKTSRVENVAFVEEWDQVAIEDMEDLMDIASCLYRCDRTGAKTRYNQLRQELKSRFLEHMLHLGKEPFSDRLASIQALIATANALMHNGMHYPTEKEVEELFDGLFQIIAEDAPTDKIFSLRSKMSFG